MTIDPDRIVVDDKAHVYFKKGLWHIRFAGKWPVYNVGLHFRGVAASVRVMGREMFMARIRAQREKREAAQ